MKTRMWAWGSAVMLLLSSWWPLAAQERPGGGGGGIRPTNNPPALGALIEATSTTPPISSRWVLPGALQASATNAQPPSTILTNIASTGAITNANGNQFGAISPLLTITNGPKITNIIDYINLQLFGSLQVSTNLNVTNWANFGGSVTSAATIVSAAIRNTAYAGNRALISGAGPSATLTEATTTDTEIGFVNGVTSGIQAQLNQKTTDLAFGSNALQTAINLKANTTDLNTQSNLWQTTKINIQNGAGNANLFTNATGISTFTVLGNQGVSGTLDVTNSATLRAQNTTLNLDPGVNNASAINFLQNGFENFDIFQASDGGTLRFRENSTTTFWIGGSSFRVFKPASFDTNVSILGSTTNTFNLGVGGNLLVSGYSTFNFDAVFNSNVGVTGGEIILGSFNAKGSPNLVDQDLTISGPLVGNGSATFNSTLRIPRASSPTTVNFGEMAGDDNVWAANRGAVQFFDGTGNTFLVGITNIPTDAQVPVYNATTGTWSAQNQTGSGGGVNTNGNQFGAAGATITIKNGVLLTNASIRWATFPNVTVSRAAAFNANGDLTNAATTATELDFVNGVTSSVQTQLNGKQNGQTNAAQFGASTTLTLRDGVTVTNGNHIGTLNLTNPPGASARLRIWQTNGNAYTEFTVPAQWLPTNSYVFWQTNAAAGKVLKVNSVSIASGVSTINITNDFVAGNEVTFSDPDNKFIATDVTSALAELDNVNGSGPNALDGKVSWTQLVGVPAGFADGVDNTAQSTNNVAEGIGTLDITNAVKRYQVVLGSDTNVVLNWNVTNYYIVSPSNTFTVSWINPPAAGSPAQSMFLELRNTNSTAGFFPTNGFNGSPVIMLAAPSTNTFTMNFDGTNFWVDSGQVLTTGLGDTNVFNVQPVIISPMLSGTNLVNGNIGYIEQYPTGTGGANTNFTLLVNTAASFVINGFTNVSFRALYGGTLGLTYTFTVEITNGSGSNRTLEFSATTNNWLWSYAQGAIAPTTLTNSERIVIEGKLRGTNINASYAYFPWP